MVSASEDRRLCCSRPGWSLYCCVVSLDKKRCSTLSLFTQVYKWVLAATAMDKHPFQRGGGGGGVSILLVLSCYRNWLSSGSVKQLASSATDNKLSRKQLAQKLAFKTSVKQI